MKKEFIIKEDHHYFNNCHASTIIKLPNEELLTAYFAGTREGSGDTAIWLSRNTAGKWEVPERIIFQDGIAHWNPVLYAGERQLQLFYKVGSSVHSWKTMVTYSDDLGRTWSKGKELVEGESLPRGPVKNKLLSLSNGALLAPGSIETEDYWDAFVDYSEDDGGTWKQNFVPFEHKTATDMNNDKIWDGLKTDALWENDLSKVYKWDGIIQPTLWESTNGKVHMLLRSTRGFIYRSDSSDFGKTWCTAYPIKLPNNNSGIDIEKLENGILALVYNPISGNWTERSPISVSFSTDNGDSWTEPYHFETEKGEFSYPAIIKDQNQLHITYTWNRKNIVYQVIDILN